MISVAFIKCMIVSDTPTPANNSTAGLSILGIEPPKAIIGDATIMAPAKASIIIPKATHFPLLGPIATRSNFVRSSDALFSFITTSSSNDSIHLNLASLV